MPQQPGENSARRRPFLTGIRHFLSTAEMTHAFALGYDWLYDVWRGGQRDTLREAMVTLGLLPALEGYTHFGGWSRAPFNINQVCNGGIGMGALAILDEEPELASTVLFGALQGLPFAMRSFEPDGAWLEGPTYWHYATRYNTYFLAGLETALGDDFGLSSLPGFSQTGWFPVYLNGSSGQAFNFADAVFVGVKAGENGVNHGHLDLGTFVVDALGERWAVDLGADDYGLPGYFSPGHRWRYYRLRAEGHNTLILGTGGAADQNVRAFAPVVRFSSEERAAFAIADLSQAYAGTARRALRGIALLNNRQQVLVQDEIAADVALEGWWFMHTRAEVELSADSTSAMLRQYGQRLWLKILTPTSYHLNVIQARPLPASPDPIGQNENEGVRKLAIKLPRGSSHQVAVLMQPLRQGDVPPMQLPSVVPLASW